MNTPSDDFLYTQRDSLELEEQLEIDQYYDQLLVLTAIASYNREENIGKIRGKQAMMGESDMNIHIHCLAYETALKSWPEILSGEKSLEDVCKNVHEVLLHGGHEKDYRVIPGKLRRSVVFIAGESGEVSDAQFICPSPLAIPEGFKKIEDFIKSKIRSNNCNTKLIGGYIHYLLNKLHPFIDGNGRLARIMSISLIEIFGEKDARGFTFLSEILKRGNINKVTYGDVFDTPEEKLLTKKIADRGVSRVYSEDGKESFSGNEDLTFGDYISALDIETPAERFKKILEICEENNDIIYVVVEVFLKAKSLPGDHILIWKFINRLFDAISEKINNGTNNNIEINKDIINEVIPQIDGRLKKSSVKNLLILINHIMERLKNVGISISIEEDFYTKSAEVGILGTDVVTTQVREKIMNNI